MTDVTHVDVQRLKVKDRVERTFVSERTDVPYDASRDTIRETILDMNEIQRAELRKRKREEFRSLDQLLS